MLCLCRKNRTLDKVFLLLLSAMGIILLCTQGPKSVSQILCLRQRKGDQWKDWWWIGWLWLSGDMKMLGLVHRDALDGKRLNGGMTITRIYSVKDFGKNVSVSFLKIICFRSFYRQLKDAFQGLFSYFQCDSFYGFGTCYRNGIWLVITQHLLGG